MLLESSLIKSVHIEKAGGTTVKKFWVDRFGANGVYFYYPTKGGLYSARDEQIFRRPNPILYTVRDILTKSSLGTKLYKVLFKGLIKPQKIITIEQLPPHVTVIHGHFHPDHFNNSIPHARLVTVLREPLSRIISHWHYWQDMTRRGQLVDEPTFDQTMTFEDFALSNPMINYQAKYLGRVNLSDFTTVGVTEHLDCFCRAFDSQGRIPIKRLNRSQGQQVAPSAVFIEEFKRLNSLDYQLYNAALKNINVPPLESVRAC